MPELLSDVIVVEIGGHISGPNASQELRRAGATVIKVEPPLGDPARHYLSPSLFAQFNAGKKSVILDSPEAYAKLLRTATVIIDNRSPRAKQDDHVLQVFLEEPNKVKPVIFCSIVGYDSKRHANRPALDVSVQAETGMAVTNSAAPNMPLKVGFVPIDCTTGLYAAIAVLNHLYALKNGAVVPKNHNNLITIEVSMALTSANLQAGHYLNVLSTGIERIRNGNNDLFVAPFSFYKTRDGALISIGIVSDAQFKTLCEKVLKNPELFTKYPKNADRLGNIEFEKILEKTFLLKDAKHWIATCLAHGIVCSKVNSVKESIDSFGLDFFFKAAWEFEATVRHPSSSSFYKPAPSTTPKLGGHGAHL